MLPLIISKSQSAFQSDKVISNNILVAFETLHHMKNQKKKKGGGLYGLEAWYEQGFQ